MYVFDHFMTRSSKPAPTGLAAEKKGETIDLEWDSPSVDSVAGYEYDYASFGLPVYLVPRWRGFDEVQVVKPRGGLLFEPRMKSHVRASVSDPPKYPLYGKEVRVRPIYEDGERGKYISASIQDI